MRSRLLVDALAEADLPYDFDVDGNLVVLADDESRVEELLDTVEFPDALDADTKGGGDGLVAQEVLSDLFVAADRLRHHARDPEGVLGLVAAAIAVEDLELPFGFEPGVWQKILDGAASLASLPRRRRRR